MSDDWGWDEPSAGGHGSGAARSDGGVTTGVCATCGETETWCQCDAGDLPTSDAPFVQPRPPVIWLGGAIGAAVLGLVIGAVFGSLWLSVIGWLLAGPAAVLIYGHFVGATTRVSAMSGYGRPTWLPTVMRAVPILILIAVAVCAYSIADYIARHW